MRIKDLPEEVREVLINELDYQNKNYTLESKIFNVLDAQSTEDGYNFWYDINQGNYKRFYKKYPIKNDMKIKEKYRYIKTDLKIELHNIKEVYIDRYIQLINEVTEGNYLGIKIDGNSIIVEDMAYNHAKSIIDLLVISSKEDYINYTFIKNIIISPLK